MNIEELYKELEGLVNKKIRYMNITCNMLCIGIGEPRELEADDKIIDTFEYRIHVQCFWRIINNTSKEVKMSLQMAYENIEPSDKANDELNPQFEYEDIEKDIVIDSFCLHSNYDLSLYFSNGDVLEVIKNAIYYEDWRLIHVDNKRNSKHIVIENENVTEE